jgi:hypothetical protein
MAAEEAQTGDDGETRECPFCKEEIRADAIKCKHCGSRIEPERLAHGGTCPFCKEEIHVEAVKCKHCGSDLRTDVMRQDIPYMTEIRGSLSPTPIGGSERTSPRFLAGPGPGRRQRQRCFPVAWGVCGPWRYENAYGGVRQYRDCWYGWSYECYDY